MKVFIDSSVIIASLLSATGGSTLAILFCETKMIDGFISPEVVKEIKLVIERKFPEKKKQFEKILTETNLRSIKLKDKKLITRAKKWIKDPNDAPILAAAKQANVDYLITLDIRHFIKDPNVTKKSGMRILTPGDFLEVVKQMFN